MAIDTLAERRALLGIPTPANIPQDIYIGSTSVATTLATYAAEVDAEVDVGVGLQFINLATQQASVELDQVIATLSYCMHYAI